MPVQRKNKGGVLITTLSIILLLLFLLRFDVVTNAIDPSGKLKLAGFADDAFPIVLGALLIVIGMAAAATVWVAVSLIVVGVGMLAFKGYAIWKRKAAKLPAPA